MTHRHTLLTQQFMPKWPFWGFLSCFVCLLLLMMVIPARAGVGDLSRIKTTRAEDPSYQAVFTRVSQAWRAGDQKALASLIHPDGLVIINGGHTEKAVNYSPSQAFYYFRNLFLNRHTLTFAMTRIQKSPQGDRVHGLASWESTTTSGRRSSRLVIVLARHQGHWYLNEITTIK